MKVCYRLIKELHTNGKEFRRIFCTLPPQQWQTTPPHPLLTQIDRVPQFYEFLHEIQTIKIRFKEITFIIDQIFWIKEGCNLGRK